MFNYLMNSDFDLKIVLIFILCFLIVISSLVIREWKKLTVKLKEQDEFNKNISHDIYVLRLEIESINNELDSISNNICSLETKYG